jgi:regulation of enolase protein 1 (concanavalin A-like superfamily)
MDMNDYLNLMSCLMMVAVVGMTIWSIVPVMNQVTQIKKQLKRLQDDVIVLQEKNSRR